MNNNNNRNTNRRRGRGNRNQSGGGNQSNRIDSRARGNAPQMLEKYKKLAQDAQHNGDRVQAEYYLQFADHYFRVLADSRTRQDEVRGPRRPDERDMDEGDEDGDFDDRRRPAAAAPGNRQPRPRQEARDDARDGGRNEGRSDNRYEPRDELRADNRGESDAGADFEYEPADNPFLHQTSDDDRPRRGAGRPRRAEAKTAGPKPKPEPEPKPEIDAAVLPPSIGARETASDEDGEDRPAPRRRRKPEDDGAISAVG